jgi:hypothetical protein
MVEPSVISTISLASNSMFNGIFLLESNILQQRQQATGSKRAKPASHRVTLDLKHFRSLCVCMCVCLCVCLCVCVFM